MDNPGKIHIVRRRAKFYRLMVLLLDLPGYPKITYCMLMVDSVFFDKRDDRLDDLLHAEFYLDADVLDWKPTTGKTIWHLKN